MRHHYLVRAGVGVGFVRPSEHADLLEKDGYDLDSRAELTLAGAGRRGRRLVCIFRSPVAYWGVHRTTLVIDPRKLSKARKLLGTKGIKDTIERALDEVIAYEARRKAVEQLRAMDGLELDDPKVMARAWR